jgi:hypothetical protein
MTRILSTLSLVLALIFFSFIKPAGAVDTWQQVYTILSTNCSGSSCHVGGANSFDATASSSALYSSLVGVAPANGTALAKGDKLVDPGYPARSFLLRSVGNCLSTDLALEATEASTAHDGLTALQDQDIELIRQWILYGAPETGEVVSKSLIDDYYTVGGIAKIQQPNPPKSCEGFQVHMGPLFFEPREESEWYQKYDLNIPDSLEVTGLELYFNDESHHFILRKFLPGTASSWPQGITPLNPLTAFDSDKDYVMAWQDNGDVRLPNGTAYFWAPSTSLDLNFHMFNYHNEILPGEVYMNVYTQPKGTALKEMKSKLINSLKIGATYNGINLGLIPNDGNDHTFTDNDGTNNASIWTLTSHTHKYGKNFDIFFENNDGSKGRQVFDGTYDYISGFQTGVYDWEHPPTAMYEPFLDMNDTINNGIKPKGLVYEVTYNNNGPNKVGFGFTTVDEMMIFYMQYVDGSFPIPVNPIWTSTCATEVYVSPCNKISGIADPSNQLNTLVSVFPNPTTGLANISYSLSNNTNNVSLTVVNMLGEIVTTLVNNESQPMGEYAYQIDGLSNGVYFIRLAIDGKISTLKIVAATK